MERNYTNEQFYEWAKILSILPDGNYIGNNVLILQEICLNVFDSAPAFVELLIASGVRGLALFDWWVELDNDTGGLLRAVIYDDIPPHVRRIEDEHTPLFETKRAAAIEILNEALKIFSSFLQQALEDSHISKISQQN